MSHQPQSEYTHKPESGNLIGHYHFPQSAAQIISGAEPSGLLKQILQHLVSVKYLRRWIN